MDRTQFRPEYRSKNRFVWDPLLDNMWINHPPGTATEIATRILTEYGCANINGRKRSTYYGIIADPPASGDTDAVIDQLNNQLVTRFGCTVKTVLVAGNQRIQIHVPREMCNTREKVT